MCAPAALAVTTFALKAGGALLDAHAQNKAAQANIDAANANQATELNTLTLRGVQQTQSATDAEQDAARKTTANDATVSLGAAENGVSGNSVDALHHELQTQLGMYNDSVAENLRNDLLQLNQEKAGVVARTQARINASQPANPFATGLKLAGAALGSVTQYTAQQPAIPSAVSTDTGPTADALPALRITPSNATVNPPMAPVTGIPSLSLRING